MDVAKQQELIRIISEGLVENIEATRAEVVGVFTLLGDLAFHKISYQADGEWRSDSKLPEAIRGAVAELKREMYAVGSGTWLSMQISVLNGDVSTTFEYDEMPQVVESITSHLGIELRRYPRARVPQWMLEELDESWSPDREPDSRNETRDLSRIQGPSSGYLPKMPREEAEASARGYLPEEDGYIYLKISHEYVSERDVLESFLEVDGDCYEVRKVCYFPNGSADWASLASDGAYVQLSEEPVVYESRSAESAPRCVEILPEEFQAEWLHVTGLH
ncbi:hypothetical protein NN3_16720 [Nocardia neocaledoniensis NBRC 108232]|uniref:DUF6881 domain-containing protein n=1 Tax=Nocardia neocaledoniensis TaxID=236511 RepID=A0A317NQS6_9NOCA|nr:hypothetical protein [Nocardia neocaledoniensis]PWV76028.1 hypothetical protein DFR69_104130 [Nocardia neocaledoniensis]GEM30665.1 hypothetical protein NN3_16720 [Nocardia neocaledoniensis NBRC 108232]